MPEADFRPCGKRKQPKKKTPHLLYPDIYVLNINYSALWTSAYDESAQIVLKVKLNTVI